MANGYQYQAHIHLKRENLWRKKKAGLDFVLISI